MMQLLKLDRTGGGSAVSPSPIKRDAAGKVIPFRIPNEFYPTPPEAVRALLSVESFKGTIWEPACGDGGIADILKREFHITWSRRI